MFCLSRRWQSDRYFLSILFKQYGFLGLVIRFLAPSRKKVFWGYSGRNRYAVGDPQSLFIDRAYVPNKFRDSIFRINNYRLKPVADFGSSLSAKEQDEIVNWIERGIKSNELKLHFLGDTVCHMDKKILYIRESAVLNQLLTNNPKYWVEKVAAKLNIDLHSVLMSVKEKEPFLIENKLRFRNNSCVVKNVSPNNFDLIFCPTSTLAIVFLLSGIRVFMTPHNPFYPLRSLWRLKYDIRIHEIRKYIKLYYFKLSDVDELQ